MKNVHLHTLAFRCNFSVALTIWGFAEASEGRTSNKTRKLPEAESFHIFSSILLGRLPAKSLKALYTLHFYVELPLFIGDECTLISWVTTLILESISTRICCKDKNLQPHEFVVKISIYLKSKINETIKKLNLYSARTTKIIQEY